MAPSALIAEGRGQGARQPVSPRLCSGRCPPTPAPASTDEKPEETGEAFATLHYGGNTPFNEGSSEVMFSEGRPQEELCFLVAANRPYRAPEGAFALHTGPRSQPHKMLFGVCQWGGSVCSCNGRCLLPGSPWQPRCVPGSRFCLGETASVSEAWGPQRGLELCPPTVARS